MKKQTFVKLSELNLPLDDLKLDDDELIAIKGGKNYVENMLNGAGNNCDCGCENSDAGDGNNCNCECG